MNNTPMTSAGNTEICNTVRQSNHTSRNPTARGATASAPMVPPMAWMPSARALRSGIFWVSTPVAMGCQAASPMTAMASRMTSHQYPGAREAMK